jgi:hypothetical protein
MQWWQVVLAVLVLWMVAGLLVSRWYHGPLLLVHILAIIGALPIFCLVDLVTKRKR